jgi:hypothetical protein
LGGKPAREHPEQQAKTDTGEQQNSPIHGVLLLILRGIIQDRIQRGETRLEAMPNNLILEAMAGPDISSV